MAVPTSPATANYTQPSVSNTARRDTITITADGKTSLKIQRLDSAGNLLDVVDVSLVAAGGQAVDFQNRVYGNVAAGSAFLNAVETILAQADGAIASWAAAGKFNR